MDEQFITLQDEDGTSTLAEILFTLPHEGNNYVFMTLAEEFDDEEENEAVLVYKYIELEDGSIGELVEIDDDDEETWEMLDEVLETFLDAELEI